MSIKFKLDRESRRQAIKFFEETYSEALRQFPHVDKALRSAALQELEHFAKRDDAQAISLYVLVALRYAGYSRKEAFGLMGIEDANTIGYGFVDKMLFEFYDEAKYLAEQITGKTIRGLLEDHVDVSDAYYAEACGRLAEETDEEVAKVLRTIEDRVISVAIFDDTSTEPTDIAYAIDSEDREETLRIEAGGDRFVTGTRIALEWASEIADLEGYNG